jgi:streptolysin S family bacteriocin protoxin
MQTYLSEITEFTVLNRRCCCCCCCCCSRRRRGSGLYHQGCDEEIKCRYCHFHIACSYIREVHTSDS